MLRCGDVRESSHWSRATRCSSLGHGRGRSYKSTLLLLPPPPPPAAFLPDITSLPSFATGSIPSVLHCYRNRQRPPPPSPLLPPTAKHALITRTPSSLPLPSRSTKTSAIRCSHSELPRSSSPASPPSRPAQTTRSSHSPPKPPSHLLPSPTLYKPAASPPGLLKPPHSSTSPPSRSTSSARLETLEFT